MRDHTTRTFASAFGPIGSLLSTGMEHLRGCDARTPRHMPRPCEQRTVGSGVDRPLCDDQPDACTVHAANRRMCRTGDDRDDRGHCHGNRVRQRDRTPDPDYRHRFPAEAISHAVWLYRVFGLRLRDVELLLAERGVVVSYKTIRRWCKRSGLCAAGDRDRQAKKLRRRERPMQRFKSSEKAQDFLSAHAFIHAAICWQLTDIVRSGLWLLMSGTTRHAPDTRHDAHRRAVPGSGASVRR